jgi:hypothetical protein
MTDPGAGESTIVRFWRDHAEALKIGAAATQVILVPTLVFSLLGWVTITNPVLIGIIAIIAIADTVSVTVLLVGGFYAPRVTIRTCYSCGKDLIPEVSAFTCSGCGKTYEQAKPSPRATK